MKTKEKLAAVCECDEVKDAVKIMIAAFKDCQLNAFMRFTYKTQGEKYELQLMRISNEVEVSEKVKHRQALKGDSGKFVCMCGINFESIEALRQHQKDWPHIYLDKK